MDQKTVKLSSDHVRQALETYLITYFGKEVEVKGYDLKRNGEANVEVVY